MWMLLRWFYLVNADNKIRVVLMMCHGLAQAFCSDDKI